VKWWNIYSFGSEKNCWFFSWCSIRLLRVFDSFLYIFFCYSISIPYPSLSFILSKHPPYCSHSLILHNIISSPFQNILLQWICERCKGKEKDQRNVHAMEHCVCWININYLLGILSLWPDRLCLFINFIKRLTQLNHILTH
jgi:hypothetical protein